MMRALPNPPASVDRAMPDLPLTDPPVPPDFDAARWPIIARHWFGIEPANAQRAA